MLFQHFFTKSYYQKRNVYWHRVIFLLTTTKICDILTLRHKTIYFFSVTRMCFCYSAKMQALLNMHSVVSEDIWFCVAAKVALHFSCICFCGCTFLMHQYKFKCRQTIIQNRQSLWLWNLKRLPVFSLLLLYKDRISLMAMFFVDMQSYKNPIWHKFRCPKATYLTINHIECFSTYRKFPERFISMRLTVAI